MFANRARLALILLVWLVTAAAMLLWLTSGTLTRVVVAAGPAGSETFALSGAIAEALNAANPAIRLDVYETGGTAENLRLLQGGQVDVATVQADTLIPDGIAGIARLYHEAYHLIVAENGAIYGFQDLPGHRVAIPPATSGQSASFWFIADHYGVDPEKFVALPMEEAAADFAMIHGQVDAVFRVRAPGNDGIRELVEDHSVRLVPVVQAEALSLKQPAISPGVIPIGSYRGAPPLPVRDLETAVLDRLLVVREDLPVDTVYAITRDLFELRSDLVSRNQLAGFIRHLGDDEDSVVPAHPGARRYFDREKPGLLQANARLASAGLYVLVILSSALFALRSHWLRLRRIRMGDFNHRLMEIAHEVRVEDRHGALLENKNKLIDILAEVVGDLDKDRVSQEEFEHFSFTWQAVDALLRDKLMFSIEPGTPGKAS
jgi:TRAP transporter TAXI family solute receptor